ncbi:MAG: peptidylprolyl isomerase [Deltaproteobacteria bacterium]|nr:peptidylprolyl isomerase [Deltaproteobacteria bacterium]
MTNRAALLLTTLAVVLACKQNSPAPSGSSPLVARPEMRVVARVNGAPITEGELRRAVVRLKGRAASDEPSRKLALEALLFDRAVRFAARKAEISVPEEAVDAALLSMRRGYLVDSFDATLFSARLGPLELREVARERLVVDALLRKEGLDKVTVGDDEIEARWKTWPKEKLPIRIRLSQIVVRTEDFAKKLRSLLTAKGVDKRKTFAELAKKHSLGPERTTGGQLGWFALGEGPKVFEAAFRLNVGDVGDVVASDYGYHIFMVEERKAAKDVTLPDVREKIVAELREKKLRETEGNWKTAVLASVEIERDEKALEVVR